MESENDPELAALLAAIKKRPPGVDPMRAALQAAGKASETWTPPTPPWYMRLHFLDQKPHVIFRAEKPPSRANDQLEMRLGLAARSGGSIQDPHADVQVVVELFLFDTCGSDMFEDYYLLDFASRKLTPLSEHASLHRYIQSIDTVIAYYEKLIGRIVPDPPSPVSNDPAQSREKPGYKPFWWVDRIQIAACGLGDDAGVAICLANPQEDDLWRGGKVPVRVVLDLAYDCSDETQPGGFFELDVKTRKLIPLSTMPEGETRAWLYDKQLFPNVDKIIEAYTKAMQALLVQA